MNAHTPGPWWINVPPTGCDEIRAGDEDTYLICELPYGSQGNPEAANARLIAAAPELLEALRSLLSSNLVMNDITEECDKARAAIAKATGTAEHGVTSGTNRTTSGAIGQP